MKPNLRGAGIHVIHRLFYGWEVLNAKGGGGTIYLSGHAKKTFAVKDGRLKAREKKLELYIHGKDGKIQSRDSYGKESKKKDKR